MSVSVRSAVLIAGPTASGKSAYAARLARALNGVVVNADSMQVYEVLEVLTARPGPQDLTLAPHHLFGYVDPAIRHSTGAWLADVEALLAGVLPAVETVVFVGGTGLYFEALLNGFAEVPEVSDAIAAEADAEIRGLDRAGRARLLAERDPEMAHRIPRADPQRVARALAVRKATGRSLASFQDAGQHGLLDGFRLERIVIDPGREATRARVARRLAAMFESGAVDEVEALLARNLDPSLPAMKAIGVREISEWLSGAITREEAIERAVIATRQYAKRQRTWLRNRMGDWLWVKSGR